MSSRADIVRKRGSSGMALLTVLVAMMLISLMLFEFQYTTMVERKLAFNELNQVQAHYLAKSGIRMGLLRLALYARLQKDPNIKSASSAIPVQTYLNMVWSLPVPPFPPESASLEGLLKADKDALETSIKQTQIEEGQYSHTITSEANKINLNFLIDTRKDKNEPIDFLNPCSELFCHVGALLVQLIDGFIRNSEDPYEEFGNLKPEEVVYNIMDWINPGNVSYAGVDKDAYYETQEPPFKAKRNRFYMIEELRLVRGIDENLYLKLKPHVTVYSYDGRLNINTMSREVLTTLDPNLPESAMDDLIKHRNEIGAFPDVTSFVNYVSSTLGYSSFKDKFPNPDEFFTVGSESFVIESLGIIKKSASQVQRSMQVAVALVHANKAGQVVEGVTNQAECVKSNDRFWDIRPGGRCLYRPANENECKNKIAGTWAQENGQDCCQIKGQCVPPPGISVGGTGTGSGTGSGTGAAPTRPEPNALKLLHWAES